MALWGQSRGRWGNAGSSELCTSGRRSTREADISISGCSVVIIKDRGVRHRIAARDLQLRPERFHWREGCSDRHAAAEAVQQTNCARTFRVKEDFSDNRVSLVQPQQAR